MRVYRLPIRSHQTVGYETEGITGLFLATDIEEFAWIFSTLVNVYVDLVVFTRIAGTS